MNRRIVATVTALAGAALVGASAAPSAVLTERKPKFAALSGANEVPQKGDPDGQGAATIMVVAPTKLCFAILVTGIGAPAAAHIHRGPAGVAGPVVVSLAAPTSGTAGTISRCVPGDAALLREIGRFPGRFYVNVHNAAFPGGALRGPLRG
jgi:hypothetical protein